ncbi:MAG: hypothetical protein ACYTBJ_15070 [Planctomycetota bacterium]|jgi:hypothetical protein
MIKPSVKIQRWILGGLMKIDISDGAAIHDFCCDVYLKGRDDRPVARWIQEIEKDEPWFKCSECGGVPLDMSPCIRYCGQCGAPLDRSK